MEPLARRIEDHLEEVAPLVEEVVFGTSDPERIAEAIAAVCEGLVGAPSDVHFYGSHVGCSAGLRLADGRDVVLKAYQPRWTQEFLAAVVRAQGHLASCGFPCPTPLAGPVRVGEGLATVETLLPDPGPRRDRSSRARRASAAGLAEQIRLCAGLADMDGLAAHPMRPASEALFPEPHSPIFDFGADVHGATWIEDIARSACDVRDAAALPGVVAHTDWSARNVRVRDGKLVAAYDWDSLSLVPEPVAVGQAAATWWLLGEAEADDAVPSARDVAAFVRDYEAARGEAFPEEWRRVIGAAALYVFAYTARCEHALRATGLASGAGVAQVRLREGAGAFLELQELM